ncbi:MAG: hypothetical protein BAJALOKI3v1_660031, partial [Promethearchaeota archaeon]
MKFKEFKAIFKLLISQRSIRIAFVINFVFFVIGIMSFIVQSFIPGIGNDFSVYYKAGQIVLYDIENLYNYSLYPQVFRYLPSIAYLFSIMTIFPELISFLIFETFLFLINI